MDQNESVVGVMGAHLYWDWVHSVISAVTEKLDRVGALEVLVADHKGNWLFKPHQIDAKNLAELQKIMPMGNTLWRLSLSVLLTALKGSAGRLW